MSEVETSGDFQLGFVGSTGMEIGSLHKTMNEQQIKEYLRQEIINYIEMYGLKQYEAAIKFKTQQPNLNKLIKGHLELFSIDRLMRLILNAGLHINIEVNEESPV